MVATMTADVKMRIADLERQKIDLNSRIERLSYSGNHQRMLELEQEVWEIEDTIRTVSYTHLTLPTKRIV